MKTCIYFSLLSLAVGLRWNALDELNPLPTDDNAQPVFFSVAMDAVASSHFWRANLLSLRELGQFTGPIVILTNYPNCTIDNLGPKLLGKHPPKEYGNVKVFAGPKGNVHIKYNINSTLTTIRKMGFEQHKAIARYHTANAHLPFKKFTVITIDDDILVAKPLTHFLETVSNTKQLAVFRDTGGMAKQGWHCGIVVIPEEGQRCAMQWYDVLVERYGSTDIDFDSKFAKQNFDDEGAGQGAFGATKCAENTEEGKKQEIILLNNKEEGFHFPTNFHMNPKHVTTFMHLTNTHRLKAVIDKELLKQLYNQLFGKIDIANNEESTSCDEIVKGGVWAR